MNQKLIFEKGRDISLLAGKAILEVYGQDDFQTQTKDDSSPLTAADLASHNVIVEGLEELNQELGLDIPILSEESKTIPYDTRKNWSLFWLIDPLDGTKEFIKRNGEFTVNIALIEEGVPVTGFVYVPVTDELYYGNKAEKIALKLEKASLKNESKEEMLQSKPVAGSTVRIIASKSHLNDETKKVIDMVEEEFENCEFLSSGSSLKLCRVAEGKADLYPRYAPTMEWDTAAADAVCRAAGCEVRNTSLHTALEYNKENQLNPYFYVTSDKRIQAILETL